MLRVSRFSGVDDKHRRSGCAQGPVYLGRARLRMVRIAPLLFYPILAREGSYRRHTVTTTTTFGVAINVFPLTWRASPAQCVRAADRTRHTWVRRGSG